MNFYDDLVFLKIIPPVEIIDTIYTVTLNFSDGYEYLEDFVTIEIKN